MTEWICDSLITGAADAYLAELAKLAGNTHLTFQHEIEQLRKTQSQQEQAQDKRLEELETRICKLESRAEQEQAVNQLAGWEKVDFAGCELPVHAVQYAAVIDQKTKLMWAVNPHKSANFPNPAKAMTWQEAQDWLKYVNRRSWCGHKDWRLPTVEELKTLLLPKKLHDFFMRQDVFTDVSADDYCVWTSSPYADDGSYAWIVDFSYGYAYDYAKYADYYVRVVRSGQ